MKMLPIGEAEWYLNGICTCTICIAYTLYTCIPTISVFNAYLLMSFLYMYVSCLSDFLLTSNHVDCVAILESR